MIVFYQASGYSSLNWTLLTLGIMYVFWEYIINSLIPMYKFISCLYKPQGSKYRQTVPLGFGTIRKLSHHSSVSFTPSGVVICCSCSHSIF